MKIVPRNEELVAPLVNINLTPACAFSLPLIPNKGHLLQEL